VSAGDPDIQIIPLLARSVYQLARFVFLPAFYFVSQLLLSQLLLLLPLLLLMQLLLLPPGQVIQESRWSAIFQSNSTEGQVAFFVHFQSGVNQKPAKFMTTDSYSLG